MIYNFIVKMQLDGTRNTTSFRKYFNPLYTLGTVCFREIEEDIWIYNFMNLKM